MKKTSAIKTSLQVLFDILIIFASFIISFFLRGQIQLIGNEDLFSQYSNYIMWYALLVVILKMIMFWVFGLYRRVWKYASLKDMTAIIEALLLSSVILIGVFYLLSYPINISGLNISFTLQYFPRSVLIIDFLLSFILITISRFSVRFFNELRFGNPRTRKKRVLIVGAGDAGEMMVREMIRQRDSEYQPIGFLDDDYSKIKKRIHGIKVLGPISGMEGFIKKFGIDEVLIAMPSASGKLRKEVALKAKETGANAKTLPSLYDVIDGRAHLYQVREIEVEDILGREPVKIKTDEAMSEFKDKTVLITGAGGSIGSEICRQLLRFNPSRLIMVDHSENNLFYIESELNNKYSFSSGIPIVANIKDKQVMRSVFKKYKPEIVFHTAAYKHVPLMQLNPEAAIQNNFMGTKEIAKVSMDFGVKRFVMLSSDKAVKPKNIMGVSKLLAENYLRAVNGNGNTNFMIVRFGNVLESNGSVINIFKNQIRAGGPVSVTHPDMSRYIMTIAEAAQLALQASLMGDGGEIFVLNMGKPINILELAKNMIRLYGMRPEEDIDIIYTGPREGEKLNEELSGDEEELISSGFEYIYKIDKKIDKRDMINILFNIEKEMLTYDYTNLFKDLKKLVPEFDDKEMWFKL
ncbi:polysaccharide biosynthesis protein [Actinomycetota bacterium]